jgi:hypothetical protein
VVTGVAGGSTSVGVAGTSVIVTGGGTSVGVAGTSVIVTGGGTSVGVAGTSGIVTGGGTSVTGAEDCCTTSAGSANCSDTETSVSIASTVAYALGDTLFESSSISSCILVFIRSSRVVSRP